MEKENQYHHGNLRAALLKQAKVDLGREGHEQISLRRLAANIGVAPSAPYNHFKSRTELLAALVIEGSKELAMQYRAALDSGGTSLDRLERACLAYVNFATEHPALFRLMFMANLPWDTALKDHIEEAMTAFRVFERLIADTLPGASALTCNAKTLALWSAIHGMATLRISGKLDRSYIEGQTDHRLIKVLLGTE